MGFTKLDAGIVYSSIMAEPAETFKVWVILMALCGPDGVARVSDAALPGICHLPTETIDEAMKKLSGPDPHSRSEKSQGARVKRVDGGYFLINYQKYRERGYSPSEAAVAKREYRARKSGGEDIVRTNRTLSAEAEAEADITPLTPRKRRGRKQQRMEVGKNSDPRYHRAYLKQKAEEERREAEAKKKATEEKPA